ncbi:MAG: DUF1905 domain-containing protein [Flammeovirgaceae bacterium]
MLSFHTTIEKFDKKGEKTGWSYIIISSAQAKKLKTSKASFRVKGTIDTFKLKQTALIPMGDGDFILPVNATMRKALGKRQGDRVKVSLAADDDKYVLSPDLMACLRDDPGAFSYFKTLSGSHQKYFSKWIESAKTTQTKTKRILMAVTALGQGKGYPEMIRMNKKEIW